MGRHGRSKNMQASNSRKKSGRGKSKFDVPEKSSSSSESETSACGKINIDVPEESASSSKTTGRGKIKGDVPEESASSSKTTGRGKIKGEHMQGVKATRGHGKGKGELTPDDELNRAIQKTREKVINLCQESYEDIPVFPYGYGDKNASPPDNKRAPPLWVTETYDEHYIRENLSQDWLPSVPSIEQIDNLYGQLNQHAFSVCSYSMESSRVLNIAEKDELKGTEKIVLEGTPVTSVSDNHIKNSYHMIRVKDTRDCGGFLEFLRQNSSGYVLAWRWLKDLSQSKTAVWCNFSDELDIINDLTFLKFVTVKYNSTYSIVEDAKFGFDTIQLGIDALKHVYLHPSQDRNRGALLFFHIYLVFFGEGPRSDILKRIIRSTITCFSHEHCPPLGIMIQGVITNWGNVSRTASFLRLMILELQLAKDLMKERPNPNEPLKPHPSLQKLFLQFAQHRRVAQDRCDKMVDHVKKIDQAYDLIKEAVDGKHIYGSVAYGRIVDHCLSLILHDEKLVCAIIMRDNGSDELVGEVKEEDDELVLDQFWTDFSSFEEAYKQERKYCILMRFLPDCIRLLQRWKYARLYPDGLCVDEIKTWCKRFIAYTHSEPEVEAGDRVVSEWKKKRAQLQARLKELMQFIKSNRPY